LCHLIEEGVENPIRELKRKYTVADKDIVHYLKIMRGLVAKLEAEKANG
jgi:hypothetical protein